MLEPNITDTHDSQDWFGQPRGLTILFLTEMWTIFSFYGMRTLLVYYMTKGLLISQEHSSLIYGGYGAAACFTPVVGGIVADRFIGKRNAVIIGGVLMAAGHFLVAFPSLFYFALVAIAIGNGFSLPSLSSQINSLYSPGDPRISSAYNIYYLGINVGGFFAPFVCGTLGELYGWHWGFGAAGVGMLFGLFIYVAGARYLPTDRAPKPSNIARIPVTWAAVRSRVLLLLGVMAVVVIFRGAYEQSGNSIALWADVGIDRRLTDHWSIPATWFQALNPLLIFLLTPFLVSQWTRLAKQDREPSSVMKMVVGAAIVAASYGLIVVVSAHGAMGSTRPGWPWLALFFFLMTVGELFILPVGLSLFGRLAPKGYDATAIATWFFAAFVGNLLAGALGTFWSHLSHSSFFALIAGTAGLAALALGFLVPWGARAERELKETNRRLFTGASEGLSTAPRLTTIQHP